MENITLIQMEKSELVSLINNAVNNAVQSSIPNAVQNAVKLVLDNPENKPIENVSDIIFIHDVCKLINFKQSSIHQLVHEKKIPFIKKRGIKKLMFSRTAIMNWLQNETTKN